MIDLMLKNFLREGKNNSDEVASRKPTKKTAETTSKVHSNGADSSETTAGATGGGGAEENTEGVVRSKYTGRYDSDDDQADAGEAADKKTKPSRKSQSRSRAHKSVDDSKQHKRMSSKNVNSKSTDNRATKKSTMKNNNNDDNDYEDIDDENLNNMSEDNTSLNNDHRTLRKTDGSKGFHQN